MTPDQEQIDEAALSRFTLRMREKLAASRAKGRDGWHDPALCPETRLAEMLIGHLPKGNPGNLIDLAILAMMLQERGADEGILLGPLARGDLAQPWRPISEALKGGPAIWARLHADLSVRTGRPEVNSPRTEVRGFRPSRPCGRGGTMPSFLFSRVIAVPGAEGSTGCHDRPGRGARGRARAPGRGAPAPGP